MIFKIRFKITETGNSLHSCPIRVPNKPFFDAVPWDRPDVNQCDLPLCNEFNWHKPKTIMTSHSH